MKACVRWMDIVSRVLGDWNGCVGSIMHRHME